MAGKMSEAYVFLTIKHDMQPWIFHLRVNNTKLSCEFAGIYKQPLALKWLHPRKMHLGKHQMTFWSVMGAAAAAWNDGTFFDKAVLNTSVYKRSNSRLGCVYVKIHPFNRQSPFYPCPQLINHLLYCRNLDCSVKRILPLIPVWNGK